MKVTKDNINKCLDKIGSEKNPRIALQLFQDFKKQMIDNKIILPDQDTRDYYKMIKEHVQFNQRFIPLLENTKKFTDLFITMERKEINKFEHIKYKGFDISEYCNCHSCNNFKFTHVKPTNEVLETIVNNMLQIQYDSIYFEVIEHEKEFHVYTKYNQIIGSRLLAIIKKV